MPSHLYHFYIKVDGTAMPEGTLDVLDITVENSLHLPDVGTVRIHDNELEWLNKDTFKPGADVEVMVGQESESGSASLSYQSIFHGEVTAHDIDMLAGDTTTLTVHCMDQSHRMHRGRKSKTFVQQSDSDIITKIAQQNGLSASGVMSTTVVHDWVMQNNLTDWEFAQERAKHAGFRLFVEGKNKLNLAPVDHKGSEVALKWGEDLFSFHPRVTANQQVDEVKVQGWDRKSKQAIIGSSSTPKGIPETGYGDNGGGTAKKAFGAAKMVVVDRPIFSQSEADKVAQSVHDEIGGHFIEADGVCAGNPALKPETIIKIDNVGKKYNGKYQLSTTTHILKPDVYETHFTINGKRDDSLLSIIKDGAAAGHQSSRIYSVAVGIVTDNKDPDELGRVKVKLPWLSESDASDWAAQAAPMTGNGRGFYYLPEIDDEVLVGFEMGDVRRPYILGGLWNGKDKPVEKNSEAVTGGKVNHRIIKSRIGHTFLIDDTDDKGEMKMTTKSGHVLTINDKDQKIETKTKDGHVITLDDKGAKISVVDKTGNNKMTIDSNANSIALECQGNYSVKATGSVSIEGQQGVTIKSPMTTSVEGTTQLSLKSSTMAEMDGGPMTTIKGGMVKIN